MLRILMIFALASVIAGCASVEYLPPPDPGAATKFQGETSSSLPGHMQILAFKDPASCAKHPNGIYVGRFCQSTPGGGCSIDLSAKFSADVPVTLKGEYKAGDLFTSHVEHCNVQFTFTPEATGTYRALFAVDAVVRDVCSVALQQRTTAGQWIDVPVQYDKKQCIWW